MSCGLCHGTQLELVCGASGEADNGLHTPLRGKANLRGSETVLRGMQAESGQPSTGKLGKSTSGATKLVWGTRKVRAGW